LSSSSNNALDFPGTTPAISANGNTNGIVWAIDATQFGPPEASTLGPAVLHAFDATNVANELYNSAQMGSRDQAGNGVKFTTPTIANGKVFIGTQTEITVYGLLNSNSQTATPTFSLVAGTYNTAQSVTISDATAGAQIHYTTDGSTPTASSALYPGGAINISSTTTLQAIAAAAGLSDSAIASATYTLQAATPMISPASESFSGSVSVSITDATAGATIYYTSDGSTPTTSSTVYTTAITVTSTTTINAMAAASGFSNSAVASATYTQLPAGSPRLVNVWNNIDDSSAVLQTTQSVTVASVAGDALVACVREGSNATDNFTISDSAGQKWTQTASGYVAVGTGRRGGCFFKANSAALTSVTANFITAGGVAFTSIAVLEFANGATSGLEDASVNSSSAATGSSLASGSLTTTNALDILLYWVGLGGDQSSWTAGPNFAIPANNDAPGANGSNPRTAIQYEIVNSTQSGLTTSMSFNPGTSGTGLAIFMALKGSTAPSAAATPVISPASESFSGSVSVTITDATAGATIYYTSDGSTPTTSSTVYTTAITVTSTTTIKAIAAAVGHSNSQVASATYRLRKK
jgi:hypothetical protein